MPTLSDGEGGAHREGARHSFECCSSVLDRDGIAGVVRLEGYDGEEESSWLLLEPAV